jgi:hypothetical protein
LFNTRPFWFVVVALFAVASPASAHKIFVQGKVDGNRLRVEAYYEGNIPAQQARITVENENKEVVAEGKTDALGAWSCPAPGRGNFILRAETVGHKSDPYPLTVLQFPSDPQSEEPKGLPEEPKADKAITREEQTCTPWWKILAGIGAIGVFFTVLWLSRRGSDGVEK